MAKKSKTFFSCKLVDGELIAGALLNRLDSPQGTTFVVDLEGLEMFIRDSMCLWYVIGKKPYSEVQKKRFEEMKEMAKEIVKQALPKPISSSNPLSSHERANAPGPIQPSGSEIVAETEEDRVAFENVQNTRSSGGSLQAIATHQNRIGAINANLVTSTVRHSMKRADDDADA